MCVVTRYYLEGIVVIHIQVIPYRRFNRYNCNSGW